MQTPTNKMITVESTINAPVENVWEYWTSPEHITQWCQASDDWHAPAAENELRNGGTFKTVMAAKDGSMSFDFGGVYDNVKTNEEIDYTLGDGRKVTIRFKQEEAGVRVVETFEAENMNPEEMQRGGWQAILDNFKKYAEANA